MFKQMPAKFWMSKGLSATATCASLLAGLIAAFSSPASYTYIVVLEGSRLRYKPYLTAWAHGFMYPTAFKDHKRGVQTVE
ncbi:hypothetical protein GGS21DRAFT_452751 [Xylaria nigripes]|nr:hypothetical protein GGS21DRAFT_452751 [Xylaria nigripes]